MIASTAGRPGPDPAGPPAVDLAFTALCQRLFGSFTRSDQRRWGEVYAWGLFSLPGRKSVRRIADGVGPGADQSLQQFINQSPWDWRPVRRHTAEHIDETMPTRAWVIGDMVFPKNGSNSVGVARQFVPSVGSMLNCQVGLAISLAGPAGSIPVDWRLMLPRSWQRDQERRARTQLPDSVRHQSRTEHVLAALDQLLAWGPAARPVLIEAEHEPDVQWLLSGLEARGLHYLVRLSPSAAYPGAPGLSLVDVVARAVARGRAAASAGGARYLVVNPAGLVGPAGPPWVPPPAAPGLSHVAAGSRGPHERRVLARWSPERIDPDPVWLTNLAGARPADLLELVGLAARTADDLERMAEESGLRHFEGRSFRGWHHHVTLATIAHAYRSLDRPRAVVGGTATSRHELPAQG